jgi:stress response protein SCP2
MAESPVQATAAPGESGSSAVPAARYLGPALRARRRRHQDPQILPSLRTPPPLRRRPHRPPDPTRTHTEPVRARVRYCQRHRTGPAQRATRLPRHRPHRRTRRQGLDTSGAAPQLRVDPVRLRRTHRTGRPAPRTQRPWRAQIGWHDPSNSIDVDVCALLLRSNGRVNTDEDMVFYNQLTSPDGSVRHCGEQTLGSADLFEELQVDLPIVPDHVDAIAVCASVHSRTFGDVAGLHVRLEGDTNLVFAVPELLPLTQLRLQRTNDANPRSRPLDRKQSSISVGPISTPTRSRMACSLVREPANATESNSPTPCPPLGQALRLSQNQHDGIRCSPIARIVRQPKTIGLDHGHSRLATTEARPTIERAVLHLARPGHTSMVDRRGH